MRKMYTSPYYPSCSGKRSIVPYRIWLATMLLALLVGVLPPSPAAAMFYQPQAEEAVSPPARSMQSTTRSKMDAGAAQAPTALPKAAGGSQAGGFTTQNIADFAATPISGRVFRDFNYDGLLTASGVVTDAGVSSVLVTAYNTSGAVGSATTDANGNYTINSSGNGPYRVEFSNLPADYEPTTVNTRFITTAAGAVNVNLGINHPCDYCQNNPMVAQPIWMNGDPLVSGNLATGIWWKAFNYNNTGTQAAQHNITGSNVGALWGQAWQRSTKQLYASAAVRRHAGLGPLGLGGIYRFDFSSGIPAVSSFLDLDAAPFNIDFGTLPANGSGGRNLPSNKGTPSYDPDAFAAVGKQGIGDIDITEDEKTLFVVNLHTRSLIALDVTAGATPTTHQSYNIIGAPGVPTCTNGELRPWALTFYRGSGYLGAVCDASSSSGTTNDLQAYILRFDPASPSAGYTTALSIPLNYTKGAANDAGGGVGKEWNPWRDAWNSGPSYLHVGGTGATVLTASSIIIIRPTPILMDIEFDDNGDMAIALGDRMAMQTGSENAWPNDGITNLLIVGFGGGDLLKACHSHGANFAGTPTSGWTLESNGVCGGVTSVRNPSPSSYNTNPTIQGIGGREFYQDNSAVLGHEEALVGGLATWPGRKELIYSTYDPVYAGDGGIQYNRTTDGYLVRGYQTYLSGSGPNTGYMGKAAGVGDLEVLCDPAPLQIGNRVWDDLDGDGV
ncbi:MAG: SdrD B-like domain-containing protein, partial [Caldilinea sp.]